MDKAALPLHLPARFFREFHEKNNSDGRCRHHRRESGGPAGVSGHGGPFWWWLHHAGAALAGARPGRGCGGGAGGPAGFRQVNFFESDSHFCAKVVPRDACEAAVAAAVAERALVKLPYIGAVKSLSLLSD